MAKNRRKKRQKQRSKASVPLPPIPRPGRVAPEARPDVVAARPSGPGSEGTVVGTVVEVERASLWIEVDGERARIHASELMLGIGERPAERYTVGDHFEAFVFQVEPDHESGATQFSIRRASPYPEALASLGLEMGAEVQATVVNTYDEVIELDIRGVRGNTYTDELPLQPGESPHQRYEPGETIEGLFVYTVHHLGRELQLSVKRSAPGYVEALQQHTVGEVVSGTVSGYERSGGLLLDVDGLVGGVAPDELALTDGESARERYTVGETIEGLFVWSVVHETRHLDLSVKRNAPGYLEALQRRTVGEVVSGTITYIEHDGLCLDVDGLVGVVGSPDLPLLRGESAWQRYTIDETIDGLFVWGIDHNAQHLALSLNRNAPGYVEALQRRKIGEVVSGPITHIEPGGLWLDVHGLVGLVPRSELDLNDGQSPQQRYSVGETIAARVWMIDRIWRTVILSARRQAADFLEEQVEPGATIDAVVRGTTPRDIRMPIRVLTTYSDSSVEIPPHALSLSTGMPPRFEDNQAIRVVVVELDDEGLPTRLSHRQAMDGWEAEMRRLSHNTVVPNARPVPPDALSEAELRAGAAAVDLGPITGFIPEEELDRETGRRIATYNETYRVVVESVDDERRSATVSHERFEERWRAVAGQLELDEGSEVDGELRDFDRETALLDLGSGLLAQMSARELPDSDSQGKAARDRIGEHFPLRITAIDRDKQTIHVEPREQWLEALILETESETLEFKAVLKGDGGPRARTTMTRRSIRTINAFLNTTGGRLIIGVHDGTREVLGLENDRGLGDVPIAKKIDEAHRTLHMHLKRFAARSPLERIRIDDLVTPYTKSVHGKTLLIVECKRGPAHGVDLVVGGKKEFYGRDADSTRLLSDPEDDTDERINDHLLKRAERAVESDDSSSNSDAS